MIKSKLVKILYIFVIVCFSILAICNFLDGGLLFGLVYLGLVIAAIAILVSGKSKNAAGEVPEEEKPEEPKAESKEEKTEESEEEKVEEPKEEKTDK